MDTLKLNATWALKIQKGYPWVYAKGLAKQKISAKAGELVFIAQKKQPLAIGYYNPLTKIACRVLSLNSKTKIDEAFFYQRFSHALASRQQKFSVPYYRLVHAEGDHLPGLVIDRYDQTLVCQTSTAGMENLKAYWLAALQELFDPTNVIFRDEVPSRGKEGLSLTTSTPIGALATILPINENNLTYFADIQNGQKTGWFFDQRANRLFVAKNCQKKRVLDLYTYQGGFGILAAHHGASHVFLVDSSLPALTLAKQAAKTNNVSQRCEFIHEKVFPLLENLISQKERFHVVIADPPAFIKNRGQKASGLKGYEKLAFLSSQVVEKGGKLFIASCSHHANTADFRKAIETGIHKAHRAAKFIYKGGADQDHPVHPLLPKTHYLKAFMYQLD